MSYSEMKQIEELLEEAYQSEEIEEIARITRQILELDPENPEALMLLADTLEYSEEKLELLQRALKPMRSMMEEAGLLNSEELMDEDEGLIYIGLLQRLGFALLSEAHIEEALGVAEEIISYDPEGLTLGKTLMYRCLVELQRFGEVLERAMKDEEVSPARQHSIAIATFMLSGADNASYKALWDAFKVGPDIPLYILGYVPEPDLDSIDEQQEEDYNFSILFEDAWTISQELANWLASATILFGMLTGRFLEEDKENFLVLMDSLGITSFYEKATQDMGYDVDALDAESFDTTVLDMLRSNVYLPLK
ncbi:hypothetical protein RBH88_08360 [Aminobacterium sp. MB27-C1]|jgi:hypothetical protein|nr:MULTISPECIES: hypothetical protein [unclassified Aminobacterium]MDD3707710.1 hypothetical protein [Aminobacterium sp.]MEA4878312.1 hypothetical protein [Aminobacterium sp.]WMI70870.1 hypothetical protein RBH88_08360 [Aminobacterium sp. MB27-C1]